jgi:hypothetical protein
MTTLLYPQERQQEMLDPSQRIVIATSAPKERGGGTCCFLRGYQVSLTPLLSTVEAFALPGVDLTVTAKAENAQSSVNIGDI